MKDKKVAADNRLALEDGQPMLFGKENDKGLCLDTKTLTLQVVKLGEDGITVADLLVHDQTNKVMAQMLVDLQAPDFPVPIGVIYHSPARAYVTDLYAQRIKVRQNKGPADLNALLRSGHTWAAH